MRSPLLAAATSAVDFVSTAIAAAWPRSAVRQEIERLRDEGHEDEATCEMAFSIWLPEAADAGDVTSRVCELGYVVDNSSWARGFVTVRGAVRLQALELARTLRAIERAVESRGFVAVIGPTRPAAHPRPLRASALEYQERIAAA